MFYTTIEAVEAIVAERQRQAEHARRASSLNQSTTRPKLGWLAGLLAGAIVLAACGGTSTPVESPVSEDQAIEMAENALEAFNEGDYSAWSRDWSETMKSAIDEQAFLAFRDEFHAQLGDYTAVTNVTGAQGSDRGTYRWTYDIQFENGDYRMWFGFKEGSPLIEGVSFEEPTA